MPDAGEWMLRAPRPSSPTSDPHATTTAPLNRGTPQPAKPSERRQAPRRAHITSLRRTVSLTSAVRCALSQQEFHGDHQTVEVVRSRRNLVFDADGRTDQRLRARGALGYATSGDGVGD